MTFLTQRENRIAQLFPNLSSTYVRLFARLPPDLLHYASRVSRSDTSSAWVFRDANLPIVMNGKSFSEDLADHLNALSREGQIEFMEAFFPEATST